MDLDLSAIGGGAGVLAFFGSAVTGLIAWRRDVVKKRAAEVKRDEAIAPALLQRNEHLEKQRDEATGQFHRVKEERDAAARDRDDCQKARRACEESATAMLGVLQNERERSEYEREILHTAMESLAAEVDHLRAALDGAPGPYRATGETMAERMRRALSQPAMPAYRSTPPDGVPRATEATQPEMPGFDDDRWEPPGGND
jgi:hypothetical protein